MIDPKDMRIKANTFRVGVRGYFKPDVEAYLARIALVFEVLSKPGPMPDLPKTIEPASIRRQEFEVVWRGVDRDEVHAYLNEVAYNLEEQLAAGPPVSELHLPPDFFALARDSQATGVLHGAAIVTGQHRRAVTFCTPEGLARDLAERLTTAETCVISDVIIVSEIDRAAIHAAVSHLMSSGEI